MSTMRVLPMGSKREGVVEKRGGSGKLVAPENYAFAKLQGAVFETKEKACEQRFDFYMTSDRLVLGRSSASTDDPLDVIDDGVDMGAGDSSKLSRKHASIYFSSKTSNFELQCEGRNGLTITQNGITSVMKPETPACTLRSRALIQMGECMFCFLLPVIPPSPEEPRDWIKADHKSLHTLLLRFGYGRWDKVKSCSTRLEDKLDEELIYFARKMVAKCCIYAKAGIEKKTLREILKEDLPDYLSSEERAQLVEADLKEAGSSAQEGERRKFLRWARKFRLLQNLREAVKHSSMGRVKKGQLLINTPPPASWWTSEDDYTLAVGIYRHGYGSFESVRTDPKLSFYDRVVPPLEPGARSSKADSTGARGESEDDEEDDVPDEEEERGIDQKNADLEKAGSQENNAGDAPLTSAKAIPEGHIKAEQVEPIIVIDEGSTADGSRDAPEKTAAVKSENAPLDSGNELKREGDAETDRTKQEVELNKREEKHVDPGQKNEKAIGSTTKLHLPNPELLLRRLKSIINACMREIDRDQRELTKVKENEARARQREEARLDAAAAKDKRDAERVREREERRVNRMQAFSKKDAAEFARSIVDLGITYKSGNKVDWEWFRDRVESFRHKYSETLDDALTTMIKECHKLQEMRDRDKDDMSDEEDDLKSSQESGLFVHSLERAERVLERLDFFKYLRVQVLQYPNLPQTLRGVKRQKELPDWWRSAHDRALLLGVNKHGLNNWEAIAKDTELGFEGARSAYMRKHAEQTLNEQKLAFPKTGACLRRVRKIIEHFRTRVETSKVIEELPVEAVSTGERKSAEAKPAREAKDTNADRSSGPPKGSGIAEPKKGDLKTGNETKDVIADVDSEPALKKRKGSAPRSEGKPFRVSNILTVFSFGSLDVEDLETDEDGLVAPIGFRSQRVVRGLPFEFEVLKSEDGRDIDYVVRAPGTKPVFETRSNSPLDSWTKMAVKAFSDPESNPFTDGKAAFGLREPEVQEELRRLVNLRKKPDENPPDVETGVFVSLRWPRGRIKPASSPAVLATANFRILLRLAARDWEHP
ncbi:hypothetical protein NDN08_003457 [Rhodosorus marinus]|uniref:FHA domain-containing protein n=1 Tax=Rhodosorus marinus TaxID=101924 RepID=A0AAV8UWS3_9RHOD|nr:hypothetical protein NDN08_003457 [Rhodosorus marinus]